ncbi:MAG: TetR family transcriptional regulator [Catenulispora sp.]
MREIAAEAGVSLRVVQYYFTDKQALLDSGLTELAARLDRRVKQRAAAAAAQGTLSTRGVFEAVLGAILPADEQSRQDSLAWTAYYTAALTDPALGAAALTGPTPWRTSSPRGSPPDSEAETSTPIATPGSKWPRCWPSPTA